MNRATQLLEKIPRLDRLRRRKTQIYCVGAAKTGTHSIEAIFTRQLRTAHEPQSHKTIDVILDSAAGRLTSGELDRYLLQRDRELRLEVDSSHLNFFLLENTVRLFPKARFILTIRDPYSWVDSFANHQLSRTPSPIWVKLRDHRFQPDRNPHKAGDSVLKDKGLYSLDGYLSYWRRHNRTVLETVPERRLLVVRTDRISESTRAIARFAGVAEDLIREEQSHAYKARAKFNVLNDINREFLEHRVQHHCGDLLQEFFPEIRSKNDVLPAHS